ncbi:hypothetical protein SteCoe_35845 [Stentor coeruleus]|uniref:Hexose transporter 1 n=1 Tax=Stentor coeruleus TaxID=5963 RepID=A0A1R2ARE8_9CILI|nr:hypothetical protein SteCoe_35845 [Stentor coeruleus]
MEKSLKKHYKKPKVWFSAFNAALGSLLFSYNIGVFTSCQPCVSAALNWGNDKDTYIPIMSALLPLGAMFGALFSGYMAKFIGRRQNLIIADLIIIIASIASIIPYTLSFGIGRFLSGFSIGNFSMLCPLYINEISPIEITGRIGSMVMLFGCLGTLFAFSFALILPTSDYNNDPLNNIWIAMFLFQGLVALIQLILFLTIFKHETAPWLANKGYKDQAQRSLKFLYYEEYAKQVFERIDNSSKINDSEINLENNYDFTYKEIFTCAKGTTKAMRVGVLISVIQQFAGINAIMMYATTIFNEFGSGVFMARVFTTVTGIVKLLAVFGLLPLIDSVGRRTVLVFGCIAMGICLGAMGFFSMYKVYFVIPFLAIEMYLAFFVVSIGPICWVYSGEILPSRGMSICTGINWFSAFIVVLFFPFVVKVIGLSYTFWIFTAFNLGGALYFKFDMIETKGLAKKDIRELFASRR